MTSVSKLKKDIQMLERALQPKTPEQDDPERGIREYMKVYEEATKDMTRAEKARFDHEQAKGVVEHLRREGLWQ